MPMCLCSRCKEIFEKSPEEEVKIGYRVFREKEHCKLCSVFIGGAAEIWYIRGLWNKPKEDCGPLTVIESRELAEEFFDRCTPMKNEGVVLYEVEYVPSEEKNVWVWDPRGWAGGSKTSLSVICDSVSGTQLASKLKPIRELKRKRI